MTRRGSISLIFTILVCFSSFSQAQNWSGILDPARAKDWSNAGVVGGIPTSRANCTTSACNTLFGGTVTPSSIANALASAPANTVVRIPAGSYTLNGGINMPSNVTLRGAGADQTFLTFSGSTSCGGAQPGICFSGDDAIWSQGSNYQPGASNAATWTSGYAQGATSITLTNVGSTGISNGTLLYLDQADDTSVGANYFICEASGACSLEGGGLGRLISGVDRGRLQAVKVVSGCSSPCKGAGPFTITITPGLEAPNWRGGQSPGAFFPSGVVHDSGVEDLSMNTNAIAGSGLRAIEIHAAYNCWVKGTRQIRNPAARAVIWFHLSAHISVVDNYFYYGGAGASEQYSVEMHLTSDNLIQNNIMQQSGPILGPGTGTVVAYNFQIDQPTSPNTWNAAGILEHDAGVEYMLYEGNIGPGLLADTYHGSSNFDTLFRNQFSGQDTGKTGNTSVIELWSYNRYHNIIGNVLGKVGVTTSYQLNPGDITEGYIYTLGGGDGLASDPMVATTLMRWGNYDVVNNAVRWVSGEVPSGVSPYGSAVPASQTLPASFYLNGKPAWFGSVAWPAIGPEVTGGNISGVAGHANMNPAMACYRNTMHGPADGSGSVLNFNADACYPGTTGGGPGAPNPPTGLSVAVQ
jgi:hypothetical protein